MDLHLTDLAMAFGGGILEHIASDVALDHAKKLGGKLTRIISTRRVKTWRIGKITASHTDDVTRAIYTFNDATYTAHPEEEKD